MIEQWQRTLKCAIKCYATNNWTKVLPLVLLELRTTVKLDIGTSPAQMLYSTQLRIPGEFWVENTKQINQSDFVKHLRQAMHHQHSSKPLWNTKIDLPEVPELQNADFVFVRLDRVTASLTMSTNV